ncbi:MAG: GNAT family N-acetyltransferase [Deinococcus sp.]|uniref:GNAT family N-acetyltransferase n=1 Tax=Deinococcus sp. TaxID=47478 RepID=UPI0026DBE595|nr:GNAT family N-acetyltransferase [Deinococcus sp.]MDO4246893.1 GNAT family N-acetyltransferase [Deinococcus sp.]
MFTGQQKLIIQRFDPDIHDRSAFSCQIADSLQIYFTGEEFIRDVVDLKILGGWVAADESGKVFGYYTLGMRTLDTKQIPNPEQLEFPFKTLNFVILSRIATCDDLRGTGYGQGLLFDAVKTAYELGSPLGAQGVYLEARNDEVIRIYENFGFFSLPSKSERMIYPFKDFLQ